MQYAWFPASYTQKQFTAAMRRLLDGRTWRRHPAPFSKTERGRARREQRRFVRRMDWEALA